MPADELVHLHTERGVATLTLDSPANRNALSRRLVTELHEHLATAAADQAVRVVVLASTGGTFCAGADLSEAGSGGMAEGAHTLVRLLRAVVELPKPVIARVQGHARAGGVGLVCAADIAITTTGATFAFTEARLGLAPAVISLTCLPRMRNRDATRYFLTGETLSGEAAAESGLVTRVVADADLDASLDQVLDAFRACSPQGLRETKRLLAAPLLADFEARGEELVALSARLFGSEEAAEGMRAFLEKRPPSWST